MRTEITLWKAAPVLLSPYVLTVCFPGLPEGCTLLTPCCPASSVDLPLLSREGP